MPIRFRAGVLTLLAASFAAMAWWRPASPPDRFSLAPAFASRATRDETHRGAAPVSRSTAAASALEAAAARIAAHPEIDRGAAFAAVFNAAATADAEALVRCATELIRRDPTLARDCGNALLFALGAAGEHARAARFAADAPPELATAWLSAAYDRWGRAEPEAAIAHALALAEPARRDLACRAALSGWAQAEPARLADCAINFPPGPEKNLALVLALRAWSTADAAGASAWMRANAATLARVPNLEAILDN